ncbi:alginate O-acetyltransferase AlgX-related protein [Dinoroseobacter sp. S124A]|uniref:alginate O-acetyltransferase AlgX-related protein n=1 Tax=Dinoroseobacter sp. S124A TaxID=3415128 RepID=UPI003C7AB646
MKTALKHIAKHTAKHASQYCAKLASVIGAAALLAAPHAQAAPYCSALLEAESLPKRYAKVAPIYSDQQSGWMFTRDQLKDRYDMKRSAATLVGEIAQAFAARDVALAILIAPPRPVVAGQAQLDAAMGTERYDVAAAQASFAALLAQLAETGAIVPDLQGLALGDPALRDRFYFRRDTHWTPLGAAASASRLAALTATQRPGLFPAAASFVPAAKADESYREKGSLAEILRKACDQDPGVEEVQLYDLTRPTALDLLDDTQAGPSIALLGSSFSNRNKSDDYRFGDALARAFDADVENLSVSGGGPIGAIEAYVLSGALERRDHAMVVWELPYTESFNSTSFLRQLLGALQAAGASQRAVPVAVTPGKSVDIPLSGGAPGGIEIVTQGLKHQDMRLELRFDDGSTGKVSLRRRRAVPVEMRSHSVFGSLDHFGSKTPVALTLTPAKDAEIAEIRLFPG